MLADLVRAGLASVISERMAGRRQGGPGLSACGSRTLAGVRSKGDRLTVRSVRQNAIRYVEAVEAANGRR